MSKGEHDLRYKHNESAAEHFNEPRKIRKESSAILSFCPGEGTEFPAGPHGKQRGSRSTRPLWDSGRRGQERCGQGSNRFPDIPSTDNVTITISVIAGPSKGLEYQLRKLCITVGRIGGGADFEFDEPEASDVKCIVAARVNRVRLYDGASMSGTYVNDQRISTVELTHMSTFRVGSSLLLVSILPNQHADMR